MHVLSLIHMISPLGRANLLHSSRLGRRSRRREGRLRNRPCIRATGMQGRFNTERSA
ncbi:hypothetical protein COLINT_03375 [Collinsella intestinalis DSM 13280]|uniref:Uncharacterized protein n=1 Tax=Collinsella intestinalis DSM 13280 TaxID=521003 RepID=C4FBC1_9ACTN|nr:hypothetical protein COLINT_03375 [Collinsella intestinalis DSM 13280]